MCVLVSAAAPICDAQTQEQIPATPPNAVAGPSKDWNDSWDNTFNPDKTSLLDFYKWNGGWAPPPEEWAYRKGINPDNFTQGISAWLDGHSPDCVRPMVTKSSDFTGVTVGKDKLGRHTVL